MKLPDINLSEIKCNFIRSPGPGGQNVNKVATGVELRFNLRDASSLKEEVRTRLMSMAGTKLNTKGEIVIKATRYRTQERNKQDAFDRLKDLIKRASFVQKKEKKLNLPWLLSRAGLYKRNCMPKQNH